MLRRNLLMPKLKNLEPSLEGLEMLNSSCIDGLNYLPNCKCSAKIMVDPERIGGPDPFL
jgi:hypothetical protein